MPENQVFGRSGGVKPSVYCLPAVWGNPLLGDAGSYAREVDGQLFRKRLP